MSSKPLENLLREDRVFPPPPAFAAAANAKPGIYEQAEADYVTYWLTQALERLTWIRAARSGPSMTPTRRSIAGSPTARSTSPTTASIGTSRIGRQGRLSLDRRTG